MADLITADARGIVRLANDLRLSALGIGEEAPLVLTEIGRTVEAAAREIAAGEGSTTIPGTIHGDLAGGETYRVQAGGEGVPIAGLWEYGNRDEARNAPTFHHPVFGHMGTIVQQARHPFMRPALQRSQGKIILLAESLWMRTLGRHDLRPDSGTGTTLIP